MPTDTTSCAAPVSLSIRVLPDLSVSLAQLRLFWPLPRFIFSSWWGGGWFCYLVPLVHLWLCCLSPSWWGGGGGFDQAPLAYPQIRRGPRSARESQLTPQIPTLMSSVRSPATDSRLSRHDFCCDRNKTARPIQIEENPLSINSFIVQRKERHLIPAVSMTLKGIPLSLPTDGSRGNHTPPLLPLRAAAVVSVNWNGYSLSVDGRGYDQDLNVVVLVLVVVVTSSFSSSCARQTHYKGADPGKFQPWRLGRKSGWVRSNFICEIILNTPQPDLDPSFKRIFEVENSVVHIQNIQFKH